MTTLGNVCFSKWQESTSPTRQTEQENKAVFWSRVETITNCALVAIGFSLITAPFYLPVAYTTLFLYGLNLLPIAPPILSFAYNYFSSQKTLAKETAEKIKEVRTYHEQTDFSKTLEASLQTTFKTNSLSEEKQAILLTKASSPLLPIIQAHVHYFDRQINTFNQEIEEKKKNLQNPLPALLNPLIEKFTSSNNDLETEITDLLSRLNSLKDNWTFSPTSIENLKTDLKALPETSKAAKQFKKEFSWLIGALEKEMKRSSIEKWTPIHALEEKILAAKVEQIFVWTFLFREEEQFNTSFDKHGIHFEKALYIVAPKNEIPLNERATADRYDDPIGRIFLSLKKEPLLRKEIQDEKQSEQVLSKLLEALDVSFSPIAAEEEKAS